MWRERDLFPSKKGKRNYVFSPASAQAHHDYSVLKQSGDEILFLHCSSLWDNYSFLHIQESAVVCSAVLLSCPVASTDKHACSAVLGEHHIYSLKISKNACLFQCDSLVSSCSFHSVPVTAPYPGLVILGRELSREPPSSRAKFNPVSLPALKPSFTVIKAWPMMCHHTVPPAFIPSGGLFISSKRYKSPGESAALFTNQSPLLDHFALEQ